MSAPNLQEPHDVCEVRLQRQNLFPNPLPPSFTSHHFSNPRSCATATAVFFPFPLNAPCPPCFTGIAYACPLPEMAGELLCIPQHLLLTFFLSVKPNLHPLWNHSSHLLPLPMSLNEHLLRYLLHSVFFSRLRTRSCFSL